MIPSARGVQFAASAVLAAGRMLGIRTPSRADETEGAVPRARARSTASGARDVALPGRGARAQSGSCAGSARTQRCWTMR